MKGNGGLVFVKGEAGVGKTRLVTQLKTYFNSMDSLFLEGKCYSPTLPYSPWTEAINGFLRKVGPQKLKAFCRGPAIEIAALIPTLDFAIGTREREVGLKDWLRGPRPDFHKMPISALATTVEDESGRMAFFEGVSQFFINISKETPLILFLDDLHQSDKVTLQLLRYVTRHVFDDRLLIIGSFREEEIDPAHPLWRLVLELEKEGLSQTLALEGLSRDSIVQIVEDRVGEAGHSRQLAEMLQRTTRGNPYFILETLRLLIEQGVIANGFVDIFRLRNTPLPTSVKALMRQRLQQLDQECTELLTIGSVLGTGFDYKLLVQVAVQVAGYPEDRTLKHLETALKAGLVQERRAEADHLFEFVDQRIRTLLEEDLSTIRKRKLHEIAGEALEKTYSEKWAEHLPELAHHYVEAGNKEKAIHYSMLAGEKAASTHAYDQAIKHYQDIIDLSEGSESAKQAELRIRDLQRSIESWTHALEKAANMLALDSYNRLADLYEASITPLYEPIARRLVEIAHLQGGMRVLDIGTGTGLAAFLAAERVGPKGTVLGIDLSEGMLSVAVRKNQKFRYKNTEFKKMDETSLTLPDSCFDVSISDLGLTPFNLNLAFREIHRVLKPGGRLAFNQWTDKRPLTGATKPEAVYQEIITKFVTQNPSELLIALRELTTYRLAGFSRLTDKAVLTAMLRDAGFKDTFSTTVQHRVVFPTLEAFLRTQSFGMRSSLELAEMSPEGRKEFYREVILALEPSVSPSGLELDWELNFFTARK